MTKKNKKQKKAAKDKKKEQTFDNYDYIFVRYHNNEIEENVPNLGGSAPIEICQMTQEFRTKARSCGDQHQIESFDVEIRGEMITVTSLKTQEKVTLFGIKT